ncbi:MAG: 3-dehydroquinate synthase [Thermoleophilia bacterium]
MTAAAPVPAIRAEIGGARFPVYLGPGLAAAVGPLWAERAAGPSVLLVSDGNVSALAARVASSAQAAGLRVIPAEVAPGEGSKTLAEVERLTRLAAREGLRRGDAVVAVGGGVVGDLAGFVAASYQRGVRLVHVPTTLLAMVDSAIGGKTGVDLPEGKNYVGAIWQPDLVVMDVDALDTLPARELSCGFAEVVKYGLLEGPELFERVEAWPALPGPADELAGLIRHCVAHKLAVVARDERDLGLRASLNLGHTVGHGIEAAGGYERYRHGEAISLGLLAALRLSEGAVGLDASWRPRTEAVLARHALPTRLDPDVPTAEILEAMGRDKKADATALNMVAIGAPGDVRLRVDPPRDAIVAAIEELRG